MSYYGPRPEYGLGLHFLQTAVFYEKTKIRLASTAKCLTYRGQVYSIAFKHLLKERGEPKVDFLSKASGLGFLGTIVVSVVFSIIPSYPLHKPM